MRPGIWRASLPVVRAMAAVVVLAGCATAAGVLNRPTASAHGDAVPEVFIHYAAPVPSASPEPAEPVDLDEELADAVGPVAEAGSGRTAVAVLDVGSGESAVYGEDRTFVTASIAKVDLVAALLLAAQDAGRGLTERERQWAAAAIHVSDNAAADALYSAIGAAEGLAAANERLGLEETAPGEGLHWGLTETTAADQLTLLSAVFREDSPLTAESRAYLAGLMAGVVEEQAWGVSAARRAGARDGPAALKNGWLPRSATGLWVVNSIGRVTVDGRTLLVAALSDDQPDMRTGVELVEEMTRTATAALTPHLT